MTHPVDVESDPVPPAADLPEIDDLDHDRRKRHTRIWGGGLSLALLLSLPLAVGIGPVAIGLDTVARIVTRPLS
jgi:iron complex transport system permease protein